jgi:pyrroloquinoline quinone (PQQ) biosynthesis protein C
MIATTLKAIWEISAKRGRAMTASDFEARKQCFKDAFERLSDEHGVDQDPLMQEWYAGTLPIKVMQGFVKEYYHWEFLRGFAATYAVCPHPQVRDKIMDNLAEEHGIQELVVKERHIDMMKRFGIACLGLTDAEVREHIPSPELIALTDRYVNAPLTEGWLAGLATFAIQEYQLAPVNTKRFDAVVNKYKFAAEHATFFYVHGEADLVHRDRALDDFARFATSPTEEALVISAATRGITAFRCWYAAIYRNFQ